MGKILLADELRASIERHEEHIAKLRKNLDVAVSQLRNHEAILRRLKARARCAVRKNVKHSRPKVDRSAGVEWYAFDTAVTYGVKLEGGGWFLLFGKDRATRATDVRFFFGATLDARMKSLLSSYVPDAVVKKRGREIMCTDIKTALTVSQLMLKPKRICLRCDTEAGKLAAHSRLYERKSTRNIKIARRIGEACD